MHLPQPINQINPTGFPIQHRNSIETTSFRLFAPPQRNVNEQQQQQHSMPEREQPPRFKKESKAEVFNNQTTTRPAPPSLLSSVEEFSQVHISNDATNLMAPSGGAMAQICNSVDAVETTTNEMSMLRTTDEFVVNTSSSDVSRNKNTAAFEKNIEVDHGSYEPSSHRQFVNTSRYFLASCRNIQRFCCY